MRSAVSVTNSLPINLHLSGLFPLPICCTIRNPSLKLPNKDFVGCIKKLGVSSTVVHNHVFLSSKKTTVPKATVATSAVEEVLPPVLGSTSEPPPLFDGTTRLYTSYMCPYAQRVWILRNYKGLQDKIKLVPINLEDRPAWYKEKVYPANKVPSLEHNNEIKGESLDLIRYIDNHFEGPTLYPEDPIKREFAEELLAYSDTLNMTLFSSFKGDSSNEISVSLDHLETALSRFDDGPFFVGQFTLVDVAYAPFIERFHPLLLDVKKYDITAGRPKLVSWIEEMNKIEAYKQTKCDPQEFIAAFKKRYGKVK